MDWTRRSETRSNKKAASLVIFLADNSTSRLTDRRIDIQRLSLWMTKKSKVIGCTHGYRRALCARFVGVATRVSHVCQPAVVGSRRERGISGRYRGCTSSHRGVLHTYRRFASAAWHEVSEIPRKLEGRRGEGCTRVYVYVCCSVYLHGGRLLCIPG